MNDLEQAFLEYGYLHPQGMTEEHIKCQFPSWTVEQLANIINSLSRKGLVQFFKLGKSLAYKVIHPDEAVTMLSLDSDEKIIYQCIKASDNKGIWVKDLKLKTNIHQNVITKILKNLESKKIIKQVSVKNSTRKVYMLYQIEPTSDITGGIWFSDNELDVEFIEGISKALYKFIVSKSFPPHHLAIFPHNYAGYPTLFEIHKFIQSSGVANIDMGTEDISTLLDMLIIVPDDERLDIEWMYKALKSNQSVTDAFNECPCGSCPVFNMCSDLGPITPSKCVYFSKWLQY